MKNIQFGRMDDELCESLDSLKLKMGVKLNSFPSNKQFLEFMVKAAEDKLNSPKYMVFGFDAECEKGGIEDLVGFFDHVPDSLEVDTEILQVYDVIKRVVV